MPMQKMNENMSQETITLFDIPSKAPCRTWSLNAWKTRLLLNFKGLDYKTEWSIQLEYPDIKPRLENNVEPNEGPIPYTIPTVILPGGKYVMDSLKIATEIEQRYPMPSVHLDSPYMAKLEAVKRKVQFHLMPVYIPGTPRCILNEASVPYWYETREANFGMPLDKFEQENGGEKMWKAAEPFIKEATALLGENPEGSFIMGKTVSYADLVWGGFLMFIQRFGPDVWGKFLEISGNGAVHEDLLEGLKQWTERGDH